MNSAFYKATYLSRSLKEKMQIKNLHIIGCFALLTCSVASHAQKGFSLGVKGVAQNTWLINETDSDAGSVAYVSTWGSAFGLALRYNFAPGAGIGVDILRSDQGQRREFRSGGMATGEFDFDLTYLKIPVLFTFTSDPEKGAMFYGNIGPQFSLLQEVEIVDLETDEVIDLTAGGASDAEAEDLYTDLDFGAVLAFGGRFRLGESLFLNTGIRLDYSFNDAEDKDFMVDGELIYDPERASTANATGGIEISLSYLFN